MTKINRTFRLDKELSRALDKICVRHGDITYHLENALRDYLPAAQADNSTIPSMVKPKPEEPVNDALFDRVWQLYGKKGNKKTSKLRFSKLSEESKKAIWDFMPAYVLSTPDKQYRKNLETYINQECWNDEIVQSQAPQKAANTIDLLTDRDWAKDLMEPSNTIEHQE